MNTNTPQSTPSPQAPDAIRDEGRGRISTIAKVAGVAGVYVAGSLIGNPFGGDSQGNTDSVDRAVPENPASTTVLDAPVETLGDPATTTITVEQTTPSIPTTDVESVETTDPATTTSEVDEENPYFEALQTPERSEQLINSMTDGMFSILESLNRNGPIKKRLGVDQNTNTSESNSYEISARGYYQLRNDELLVSANVNTKLELDTDSQLSIDDLLVSGLEVKMLEVSYEDPSSERAGGYYSRSYPYRQYVSVQEASGVYVVQIETMDDETGNTITTTITGDSVRQQTISPSGNMVSSEELSEPSAIADADSKVQEVLAKIADSVSE